MPYNRHWEGGRKSGGRELTSFFLHSVIITFAASRSTPTCLALQKAANTSNEELKCTANGEKSDCDTLMCTTMLHGQPVITKLTVLPCADIPAVHITIEAAGRVFINEILSESQTIPIVPNSVTVDITLDQLDGAIGIQVR